MWAFLSLLISAAVVLIPSKALAQMSEAQKRRVLLPHIRAATDCIAREALRHPNIVDGYRTGNISPMVDAGWRVCLTLLTDVARQHDAVHGPGTGVPFVNGPYAADLPRAVLARIKGEMEVRMAAQAQADAQAREQAARREAERKVLVEQLERAANTLRDRAYECTDGQLRRLISSAETAEVLATAAMTICRREVDDAIEARLSAARADGGISDAQAARERWRGIVRQSVITSAVQMKASANDRNRPAPPGGSIGGRADRDVEASSSAKSLNDCLTTVAKTSTGQFVDQAKLFEVMLDLCRPEIETLARDRFVKNPASDLTEERKKALLAASSAAKALIGMTD